MSTPRFVDGVSASVDMLNDLLQTYMPLKVDWTVGSTSSTFQLVGLTVNVENGAGINVTATSETMPRTRLDPLRVALRKILQSALGEPTWSTMGFGVMLLQMSEEALSHLEAFQDFQASRSTPRPQQIQRQLGEVPKIGWDATSSDWEAILSNPLGVNLLTVNDTAKFLLGKSITQILADLPEYLHVLHVEPVFRDNLVTKFTERRKEMRKDLMSKSYSSLRGCVDTTRLRRFNDGAQSKRDMVDILTKPQVTFHGAPRNAMHSIVRYGFVIPGQKIGETGVKVDIGCGASFGIGIYSSPSLAVASFYASLGGQNPTDLPGIRIVVCATLMGRHLQVSRHETKGRYGLFNKQADSHVSPNEMEYIVFDTAQIIPCYVLHLDYGSEWAKVKWAKLDVNQLTEAHKLEQNARSRLDERVRGASGETPGARKAKSEALKDAAAKWFPFGFGPFTGSNFVIEELGEVLDDEEEYGEFQLMRGQHEHPWETQHAHQKASWFDESRL